METLSGFHSSTSRFLSHSLGAQDYSQTTRCKNLEITQVGLSLKRSHKTYRDPQLDRLLLCIVYDSSFDYEHVIKRIILYSQWTADGETGAIGVSVQLHVEEEN